MASIQGITVDRAGFLLDATISMKAPCRAATTGNITLSGAQTIDGVALEPDDRVLVKDQTTASQNGVYVCKTGAWEFAKDFVKRGHVFRGTRIFVTDGTVNARTDWHVTTSGSPWPGRQDIAFARIAAAASIEVTPTGGISSTNLQSALAELDSEKAAAVHTHTSADITDFTEAAQDAVGAALSDAGDIDFAYDDASGAITATIKAGAVGSDELASTAVTPGSYSNATVTVDADGRITAAASGTGSSGLTLLTSGTIAASTLDLVLTSYTSYRAIKILLTGIVPVSDDVELWMRFSTDGGVTYDATGYRYSNTGSRDNSSSTATALNQAGGAGANQINLTWSGSTLSASNVAAEGGVDAEITIFGRTNGSRWTRATWLVGYLIAAGEAAVLMGSGSRDAAQDTDAVRFLFETGDVASGDYALYGLA